MWTPKALFDGLMFRPVCARTVDRHEHGLPDGGPRPVAADIRQAEHRLSTILSDTFGVEDSDVAQLVSGAELRFLRTGDLSKPLLLESPEYEWLILSGRVLKQAPPGNEIGVGSFLESGRVGRPLTVAGLEKCSLDEVAHRAIHLALARAVAQPMRQEPIRATVTAVIVGPGLNSRYEVSRITDGLQALGSVSTLWPERVDAVLGTPGVSRDEMGHSGDYQVSELLHSLERDTDNLVLETESAPTAWSRRALEWADRILVVVRSNSDPADLRKVAELIDHAPPLTDRILICLGNGQTPTGTAALLDATQCKSALHLSELKGDSAARVARVATGNARGLVLSGGGARGFAHLGVFRALKEMGVEVDVFGGSSIGAPLAAAMADGYPPDELDDLVSRLFANVLDYTVPVAAFTAGRGITRAADEVFGDRDIEDLRLPFFGVSTNLTEADVHVHSRGSVVHAIRASCAVPGFMPPVPHNGDLLIDGGVTNNLPVDIMRGMVPRGEVIAVDVVPARGPEARAGYGLWVSGLHLLRDRLRGRRLVPPMSMTLLRSLTVGSGRRHKEMGLANLTDHLMELDIDAVPMFAFDRVTDIARKGYDEAMPQIEAWLEAADNEKGARRVAADAS